MQPNSPRISSGASGLGSNVSSWLGEPYRKSRMHAFARPKPGRLDEGMASPARASASCDHSRRPSPSIPSEPTCSRSRRVRPSHSRFGPPRTRSIRCSSIGQMGCSTIIEHTDSVPRAAGACNVRGRIPRRLAQRNCARPLPLAPHSSLGARTIVTTCKIGRPHRRKPAARRCQPPIPTGIRAPDLERHPLRPGRGGDARRADAGSLGAPTDRPATHPPQWR